MDIMLTGCQFPYLPNTFLQNVIHFNANNVIQNWPNKQQHQHTTANSNNSNNNNKIITTKQFRLYEDKKIKKKIKIKKIIELKASQQITEIKVCLDDTLHCNKNGP